MALPEPLDPVFVGGPLPAALNEERGAINDLIDEVQAKIPFPAGAQTGDFLRFDGVNWLTTETRFFEGEGRPDGVFAAPVGSRYIDKLGAQGAVEWVKRAGGDTNTGWMCLAGDTGPRNVIAIVDKGNGTLYSAVLTRVGQTVEFYFDIAMPSNKPTPYAIASLPVGFRPQYNRYGGMQDNKEGADTGGTLVGTDGTVTIFNPVATKRDRYTGIWVTSEAWPTSLPGAAM